MFKKNLHIQAKFGVAMLLEATETGQKVIIVDDGGINVLARSVYEII